MIHTGNCPNSHGELSCFTRGTVLVYPGNCPRYFPGTLTSGDFTDIKAILIFLILLIVLIGTSPLWARAAPPPPLPGNFS